MKIYNSLTFLIFAVCFIASSCKKDENENETKISSYNDDESHNMGQNCISCHYQGGNGEGWFNSAGTVFDSTMASTYPNSTIKLYTGPNATGTLKYTIEVDGKGNFYTTEDMDFSAGLYPSISGNTATKHMSTSISSGNCMSCHGASTINLWTK